MKQVTTLLAIIVIVVPAHAGWAQPVPAGRTAALAVISPPLPGADAGGRALPGAGKSPLAELLTRAGERFADLTTAAAAGKLDLTRVKVLMLGSGALSHDDGRIANVLRDRRELVGGFVESGGVLVVFTNPNDAGKLGFLPETMAVGIERVNHGKRLVVSAGHLLVTGRHRLTGRDLGGRRGTLYPGGCFGAYDGLAPVVALDKRGRYPVILEGSVGRGRMIFIHLSPGRAFLTGPADEKVSATLLIENLLTYVRRVLARKAPAVKLTERVLHGEVFEDANGDGRKDPAEKRLAGAEVTDGAALVKTDARGRYSLTLDAYSEFVWVKADFAKHKGPLWRRIRPGATRVDVGLVPRGKPFGRTPRIVYLVDVGGTVDPNGKADPELTYMLDEVSRLEPKPDVLVISGDARTAGLRGDVIRKRALPFEVVHAFVPNSAGEGVIAERDAFAKALGPSLRTLRLHAREYNLWIPSALMHLPSSGGTLNFRKRGLRSPPAFLIEDLLPGNDALHEIRLAGLNRYLHASSPGLEALVAPGPLSVSFVLADTSLGARLPVKVEMAHIRHERNRLALVELSLPEYEVLSRGRFTKVVRFREPVALEAGFYVMRFTAGSPRTSWSRNVSFVVPKEPPPQATFGRSWTAPGGGPDHTGEAADTVNPPFYLAGVSGTGARALRGSPVALADSVLVPVEGPPGARGAGAFPGKRPPLRGVHSPFCCDDQELFELWPDHALLETAGKPPRRFRFDFTAPAPLSGAHMTTGGEFLCVVDAKGSAWGFMRKRGAEVNTDGEYDRKAAARSLRWVSVISPGCRQAVATDVELFTGNECLEIATGKLKWKLTKHVLRDSSIALKDERLVVTGVTTGQPQPQQVVLVVDRETGKVIWEKVLAEVHPLDEVMTAPPAVARHAVFVGSADGVFRALRLANGDELWRFETGDSVIPLSAGPARSSGRISSGAVVSGRTVFFGAADGKIRALDRRKGTLRWSYNVGLPIAASPALSGNTLYVADCDGNLYTFVSLVGKKPSR